MDTSNQKQLLRITCWTIFLSILLTIPVFSITVLAILLAIRLSKNAYQSFEQLGTANPNNWCIELLNGFAWSWLVNDEAVCRTALATPGLFTTKIPAIMNEVLFH